MTEARTCADYTLQVDAFLADAKRKAGDGLSWEEFGELLTSLLRLSVSLLDGIGNMSGRDKKELAMTGVASLFDAVAANLVPPTAIPFWWFARPWVRFLVLAIASGAIESLIPLVRSAT